MNYKQQEQFGLDDCGVLCSPVRFRRLKGRAFDARVRDRGYEKLLSDLLQFGAADAENRIAMENDSSRSFSPSRRELSPSLHPA